MLVSDRNIPLVYQGMQGSTFKFMLTVESYIKWYDTYVVEPNLSVWTLPHSYYRGFKKATGMNAWSDHLIRPEFCDWITGTHDDLEWDEPSLDMIYGRWARERRQT